MKKPISMTIFLLLLELFCCFKGQNLCLLVSIICQIIKIVRRFYNVYQNVMLELFHVLLPLKKLYRSVTAKGSGKIMTPSSKCP